MKMRIYLLVKVDIHQEKKPNECKTPWQPLVWGKANFIVTKGRQKMAEEKAELGPSIWFTFCLNPAEEQF